MRNNHSYFSSHARDWLNFIGDEISANTLKTYSLALRPLLSFFKSKEIEKPTRADLRSYVNSLRHTPIGTGKNKGKHRAAATVNLYITVARLFCQYLFANGVLPTDISLGMKGLKQGREHKKDALTALQARMLLKSIDTSTLKGKRDYAMLTLTATSGLRTIELSRALTSDISDTTDSCFLRVQGKGRNDKSERVMVARQAADAINRYLTARGLNITTDAPLFAGCRSESPLTSKSISRIIKAALENAGLKTARITAHSLRHTAATLALQSGANITQVQQMLRHFHINTTMLYINDINRLQNLSEQLAANSIFHQ